MSWAFVFLLAATAYGFKVLGLVLVGDRQIGIELREVVRELQRLLLPLLAAPCRPKWFGASVSSPLVAMLRCVSSQ